MTFEEFESIYLHPLDYSNVTPVEELETEEFTAINGGDIDHRTRGAVTGVKD